MFGVFGETAVALYMKICYNLDHKSQVGHNFNEPTMCWIESIRALDDGQVLLQDNVWPNFAHGVQDKWHNQA